MDTTKKRLITTANTILALVNKNAYKNLTFAERYDNILPLYQEFATLHPVVFKTILTDFKFNKIAFNRYYRLYTKVVGAIPKEEHARLGANYLMFLEEAYTKHPDQKKLRQYRSECLEVMQKDIKNIKDIEEDERNKYKQREAELLEEKRQELFKMFTQLAKEKYNT